MKNIIIRAFSFSLFFVLFLLLINSIYIGIIATTDWDFRKRIESLKFENPDFDLLVLGSSLPQYGIDTELLNSMGIKSYNLALVGSSNKTCFIQLNEYLAKYSKRPRFVILAVNSNLMEFDQEGIQPVVEFTMKNQKIDIKDIPISKFRWQGTELVKKALSHEYRESYISYGQLKSIRIVPDNSDFSNAFINMEKYKSAFWIGKLAKLCSDNNIEFILIELPGVKETQNLSGIGPYKINYNDGYTADLYNLNSKDFCVFIDANKDWAGKSHFNEFGAAKFTRELVNIIPLRNPLLKQNIISSQVPGER